MNFEFSNLRSKQNVGEIIKMSGEPELAAAAVLQESVKIPEGTPVVKGYDWNQGINYGELLKTYKYSGFQATNFGKAVDEVNRMLTARDVPLTDDEVDEHEEDEFIKRKNSCTIFFGYTSNLVSSGLRETIRFLVQHNLVDAIVASAGKLSSSLSITTAKFPYLFQVELRKISLNVSHRPTSDLLNSMEVTCVTKARTG